MKTTIENLEFPCEIKKKLKMKVSMGNLELEFINGLLIKFDKTNLEIFEIWFFFCKSKEYKYFKNYGLYCIYDYCN